MAKDTFFAGVSKHHAIFVTFPAEQRRKDVISLCVKDMQPISCGASMFYILYIKSLEKLGHMSFCCMLLITAEKGREGWHSVAL